MDEKPPPYMCTLFLLGDECNRKKCKFVHRYVLCKYKTCTNKHCRFIHYNGSDMDAFKTTIVDPNLQEGSAIEERRRLANAVLHYCSSSSSSSSSQVLPCTKYLTNQVCWYNCRRCQYRETVTEQAKCMSCESTYTYCTSIYYFSECKDTICDECYSFLIWDRTGALPLSKCPVCDVAKQNVLQVLAN